jgi:carbon storage regulator
VLVLSRRPEQSFLLGDEITVTILGVEGDRVKIGIQAPRSVVVLRLELLQQIQSANSAAASSARPSTSAIAALLRGNNASRVESEVQAR